MSIKKKLVIVGDSTCGKTYLLNAFKGMLDHKGIFSKIETNTLLDIPQVNIEVDGKKLDLYDTSGLSDYDRVRPLSYLNTDAILMCFSISDPVSLESVREKWKPEVKHFCPTVPIILVGNKKDVRNNRNAIGYHCEDMEPVKADEGHVMAKEIGASAYLECSAGCPCKEGVREVLETAIRVILNQDKPFGKKKKPKTCFLS